MYTIYTRREYARDNFNQKMTATVDVVKRRAVYRTRLIFYDVVYRSTMAAWACCLFLLSNSIECSHVASGGELTGEDVARQSVRNASNTKATGFSVRGVKQNTSSPLHMFQFERDQEGMNHQGRRFSILTSCLIQNR